MQLRTLNSTERHIVPRMKNMNDSINRGTSACTNKTKRWGGGGLLYCCATQPRQGRLAECLFHREQKPALYWHKGDWRVFPANWNSILIWLWIICFALYCKRTGSFWGLAEGRETMPKHVLSSTHFTWYPSKTRVMLISHTVHSVKNTQSIA